MKATVTVIRILTGILFIFSGLVKAIDPLGLAYKMQEFFEAWGQSRALASLMDVLNNYAVSFSIIMITLEVVVGVALLFGWKKRFTTWILFILMLFFTFLTSYVLFTGKIRACGCFGDCIPLTPVQTFTKDIILLLFALFLLFNTKYISPVAKPWINTFYILVAASLTLMLQFHVMKHLPLIDCLPFKKGNNILELRKMPPGAIPDKYELAFIYEKNDLKKEFTASTLPDSTWKYVDRKDIVIKGQNNIPLINDFSLTTEEGGDATESILNDPSEYYLFFIKELPDNTGRWLQEFKILAEKAATHNRKVYVVTGQKVEVMDFLQKNNITVEGVLTCDVTSIKTAARATPTIFLMKGPVVQFKKSWADFEEVENDK